MKLSIVVVTYNQEKYIRQCIESILDQQFNFEWELVIAYDCSTDNTLLIAEEYRDKIKNFYINIQEKNVGVAINCADAMAKTKGELIAFIDGDDYDVDTHKYIKLVEVFDNNPDVTVCFGNGYRYVEKSGKTEPFYNDISHIPQKFDLDYYYLKNPVASPTSMMCRKASLPVFLPAFFYKYPNVDWMLISFCALNGKIFFLNEFLSCYRVHQKSILRSTKRINALESGKQLNEDMNKYLNYKFDRFLGRDSWYHEHLAYEYMKNKKYIKVLTSTVNYLFNRARPTTSELRYFFATLYNIQFRK